MGRILALHGILKSCIKYNESMIFLKVYKITQKERTQVTQERTRFLKSDQCNDWMK